MAWADCRSSGILHVSGVVEVLQERTQCFRVSDGSSADTPNNAVGALLLPASVRVGPITAASGPVCVNLPLGIHRIDWIYEFIARSDHGFEIAACFDSLECNPTRDLIDLIRDHGTVDITDLLPPCEEGECGVQCPCETGGECESDDDCEGACGTGNGTLVTGNPNSGNVCWPEHCGTAPDDDCFRDHTFCEADSDCPTGQTCGVNGPRFGLHARARICWPELCDQDPSVACGNEFASCGRCDCISDCNTKACGDDPIDSCGNRCTGLCDTGDPGCRHDNDCAVGSVCEFNAGPFFGLPEATAVCWPVTCRVPAEERECGEPDSDCGEFCLPERKREEAYQEITPNCEGRSCGRDPDTGLECPNLCGENQYCDSFGSCQDVSQPPAALPPPLEEETTADVGVVPGVFSVERGRAQYSVPIAVPPGVNGLQPSLRVDYTGSRSRSMLGEGWVLNGISRISRCAKSAGSARIATAFNYEDDDFCLDGMRLVAVAGENGAPGTEYRTEVDSFIRVVSLGGDEELAGPREFEARTKDGRIFRFGSGERARDTVMTVDFNDPRGATQTWWVTEIADRFGNTIHFSYDHMMGCGWFETKVPGTDESSLFWCGWERYPAEITYGGDRRITFEYEKFDRQDALGRSQLRQGFRAGLPFERDQRLKRIHTWVQDENVRSYRLAYEVRFNNSLLAEVSECVGDLCKAPTSIDYYDEPNLGALVEAPEISLPPYDITSMQFPDVNGDGRQDLLVTVQTGPPTEQDPTDSWLALATGDPASPFGAPVQVEDVLGTVMDINGDGNDDLLSDLGRRAYLSDGSNFEGVDLIELEDRDDYYRRMILFDVDGNGLTDWFEHPSNDEVPFDVQLRHQAGMEFSSGFPVPYFGDARFDIYESPFYIDVDGDGLLEMLRRRRNTDEWYVLRVSNDTSKEPTWERVGLEFSPPNRMSERTLDRYLAHLLGRRLVNDAPPGFISEYAWTHDVRAEKDDQDSAHYHYNSIYQDEYGRWQRNEELEYDWFPIEDAADIVTIEHFGAWAHQVKAFDVNGDGLQDILEYRADLPESMKVRLWMNTGSNHFSLNLLPVEVPESWSEWYVLDILAFRRSQVVDWNSDGLDDLLIPIAEPTATEAGEGTSDINWVVWLADPGALLSGGFEGLEAVKVSLPGWDLALGTLPMTADINGDGSRDVVMYTDSGELRVAYGRSPAHLLVRSITNGQGVRHTVESPRANN